MTLKLVISNKSCRIYANFLELTLNSLSILSLKVHVYETTTISELAFSIIFLIYWLYKYINSFEVNLFILKF